MKRWIVAAIACGCAALAAGGATVAGAHSSAARDTTTLRLVVAQYSDKTQGYWQSLIKSFEAQHPDVKVDLQVIDWNNITQQVNTMVQTRQYPDILNLNTYAGFAQNSLLYKASDVVSPAVMSDFVHTFAANSMYKGTQYGL